MTRSRVDSRASNDKHYIYDYITAMVRLNVSITVTDATRYDEICKTATELVALSLHDQGCIDYDLYKSTTNDDRLMIVETWQSRADLEAHQRTAHFKRLVPRLESLGTLTLVEFDF